MAFEGQVETAKPEICNKHQTYDTSNIKMAERPRNVSTCPQRASQPHTEAQLRRAGTTPSLWWKASVSSNKLVIKGTWTQRGQKGPRRMCRQSRLSEGSSGCSTCLCQPQYL